DLRDLPEHLPQAVLAIEDRRFYSHFGLDPIGLLRAAYVNLREGRLVQGGSTISQQLAKILFLEPERTLKRKVQELLLAFWLERRFAKEQILALYLNRVYLGAGAYGVDAAARRYFGKPAARVSLYEAALLAGLLKAPSRYNPANDRDLADRRARLVLGAMAEADFITEEAAAEAYRAKSRGRSAYAESGRYFADWVLSQVPSFAGVVTSDLVVVTTLDPRLQAIAESQTAALLDEEGAAQGASQAAFVALTPGGAVQAMVGGRDYIDSQFNRAVQALRQPGSAFKAFVYLAAVESGFHPDQRFTDGPIRIGKWAPNNYDGRYYGDVTLREAFARSLNSVAVQVSQQVGVGRVVDAARRLGISSALEAAPSIALGTSEVTLLELAGAYAAFANGGYGVWPYAITEIRSPEGRILYRRDGGGPGRVMTANSAATMSHLLEATVAWGTGKAAEPGRPAAGKTGTSQDSRDAWFVGYTADLVAAAWLGNDDGKAMKRVTGGGLPARLWQRVMIPAHEGLPARPLPGAGMLIAKVEPAPAVTLPALPPRQDERSFIGRIIDSLSTSLGGGSARETGRGDYYDGGTQR
ncbi:MAG: PBP1A family penicillin-binding protein, partial [Kiloniellales bacterium]|nr:PBP1A family penicillin-binding protein [Kiloniellales bacterium]